MTIDAYLNPDFGWTQKLLFFFITLGGMLLCILLLIGGVRISTSLMQAKRSVKRRKFRERTQNRVQSFYDMIISGTSVLSFSCAYVILNHIYSLSQLAGGHTGSYILDRVMYAWTVGKDFVLLLLICLSCLLNSILDRLVIPLKKTTPEEKACVRMLAMFYCIAILVFLNNIGDESEYNPVMMYYLGLMVGRFVYFDASFKDFLHALKNMFCNIYLLLLGLALTALLCFIGFDWGYLLEKNYYIVGVFYTHLFMLAVIFCLHHIHHIILWIREKAQNKEDNKDAEETEDPEEEILVLADDAEEDDLCSIKESTSFIEHKQPADAHPHVKKSNAKAARARRDS